jgi:DNA-directed RNA polymerase specialized sigma24 family protein
MAGFRPRFVAGGRAADRLARRLDSLPRREADAELRNDLALEGFQGPGYELFQHELARYGLQVMLAWVGKGLIFLQCAQKGIHGLRSEYDEDTRLTPDDVEELASETVGRALKAFRRSALVGGGWTLDGGATLKTYFIGTCLYEFANTYRMWSGERRRWRQGGDLEATLYNQALVSTPEPADIIVALDSLRAILRQIPSDRTRLVLALTADGYTHSEIADILADGATPRAVEGLLYRHRKALERRKETA